MKVKVIPIAAGALRMVPKSLVKEWDDLEIQGDLETIQTTAILISSGITEKNPENLKTCI